MSLALAPPVGGGQRRWSQRRITVLVSYMAGTTLGGLTLGALLTVLSAMLPDGRVHIALGAVVAFVGITAIWVSRFERVLPFRRVQVPAHWMHWRPLERTALSWGWMLGMGLLSPIITPAFFALLGATIAQPVGQSAVIVGTGYGAARAVVFVPEFYRGARPQRRLRSRAWRFRWIAAIATIGVLATTGIRGK